ncbi:MAG: dTDP-4-dehydrorhamnose 3,5-epimerase [Promicromonosporaceae bacterium]|nr:dTDP-4-dehydrorhamnose 3,5-epimerase [Promicromonosporaceae bacterium]
MDIAHLAINGAFVVTPQLHGDSRGLFAEVFKITDFAAAAGHRFDLKQANCSVSAAGTIRGIHFADVPPGQAKYVMCAKGAIIDVIVDIRVGSPTFGQWEAVLLDDVNRSAAYLPEGLGHAFCALEDDTTVIYLCSEPYAPGREHGVNPMDPEVGIVWPEKDRAGNPLVPLLSEKDTAAPSLMDARARGILPNYNEVLAYVASR